jgi:hypothetical protein
VGDLEGSFDDVTSLVNQHDGGTGVLLDQSGRDLYRFVFANAFCARLFFAVANYLPTFQFAIRGDPNNKRFLHDSISARGKRFASARSPDK